MSTSPALALTLILCACTLDKPPPSAPEVDSADTGQVEDTDPPVDSDTACEPAEEVCDGIDNDCDGRVDEERSTWVYWYIDADGDGVGSHKTHGCVAPEGAATTGGDCDDDDPSVSALTEWYRDLDEDGFGSDDSPAYSSCHAPEGYNGIYTTQQSGDCDDNDASVNPDQVEVCDDGLDNDCDDVESLCPMNTGDIIYASCGGLAPYDHVGATWDFEDINSADAYEWTMTTSGADTYEGLDVWLVETVGTVTDEDYYYYMQFSSTLAVTCELDGMHLVYQSFKSESVYYHYSDTVIQSTFSQFSDRPLLLPATINDGDTWTLSGVDLHLLPIYPTTVDLDAATQLTANGTLKWTLDGTTFVSTRVDLVDELGSASILWLYDGIGQVRVKESGIKADLVDIDGL